VPLTAFALKLRCETQAGTDDVMLVTVAPETTSETPELLVTLKAASAVPEGMRLEFPVVGVTAVNVSAFEVVGEPNLPPAPPDAPVKTIHAARPAVEQTSAVMTTDRRMRLRFFMASLPLSENCGGRG